MTGQKCAQRDGGTSTLEPGVGWMGGKKGLARVPGYLGRVEGGVCALDLDHCDGGREYGQQERNHPGSTAVRPGGCRFRPGCAVRFVSYVKVLVVTNSTSTPT